MESQEWRYSYVPHDDGAAWDVDSGQPDRGAHSDRSPSTTANAGRQRSGTPSYGDTKRASQTLSSVPENDLTPGPAYEIPPAPPPPPAMQPLETDDGRPPSTPSRFSTGRASLLDRASRRISGGLDSIRSVRLGTGPAAEAKAQCYGLLEEGEWSDLGGKRRSAAHKTTFSGYEAVQAPEDDNDGPTDGVGIDLSTMVGPSGFGHVGPMGQAPDATTSNIDATQSRLAAEYDQLEASGHLTKGLGSGMVGATLHIDPSKAAATATGTDSGHRIESATPGLGRGPTVRDVGRREAKERNEMVVIDEVAPGVDLGLLGADEEDSAGLRPEQSQPGARVLAGQQQAKQTSYFFPPDPETPNWKPVSMRWPYMTFLVVLSIGLGVFQEFVYQLSARRRQHGEGLFEFVRIADVNMGDFFCWKYLPTIVAVTFGVMWQIVDYEVKRLEPYYQLSRPEGALAIGSLNRDYLTSWSITAPFKALKYRHWAVFFSSIIYLIAAPLIPVLQIGSLMVTPPQDRRRPDDRKFVEVNAVWSRLLTASCGVVAVLGCLLLHQLRRKSGLLSDPKGIAGVAAMANKSHILMDFQELDTASEAAIHSRLKRRRYNLHKSTIWQGEVIKANDQPIEQRTATSPHPMMLRLVAGVPYIVFLLAFMGFIPVVMWVPRVNVIVDRLPWFLTTVASVIKVLWNTLDSDVRMMEPFYLLSRRGAPSSTLTLDYTGTIPGWLPIKALTARHYLVALVGLGGVLAEVLTVCVSSIGVRADFFLQPAGGGAGGGKVDPERWKSEETFNSVWISFTLVMTILSSMVLSACLVYHRRRHPFLPREPGTIASVLAFIHQSKMLWDFVDTETMTSRQMTVHLRRKQKTYGLGWFKGRDGHDHCGIDEEPLKSAYRHGERFTDAVKPWSVNWDLY